MLGGKDTDLPQYSNDYISYILSLKRLLQCSARLYKKINGLQRNCQKHVVGKRAVQRVKFYLLMDKNYMQILQEATYNIVVFTMKC